MIHRFFFLFVLGFASWEMSLAQDRNLRAESACQDPLGSVLKTLECIHQEKFLCTAAGYNLHFRKFHNGVRDADDGNLWNPFYWFGAFVFVDLSFEFELAEATGANKVRLRYVEKVETTTWQGRTEYPFGQVFLQHEEANVTVDNKCRLILWNQTGIEEEQKAVPDAMGAIFVSLVGPILAPFLCILGLVPGSACET